MLTPMSMHTHTASTSTSSVMRPENAENEATQTQQMWACDVCTTAKFLDFGDACRHEEACKKKLEALNSASSTMHTGRSIESKSVHSFFAPGAQKPSKTDTNADTNTATPAPTATAISDSTKATEPAKKRKKLKTPFAARTVIAIDSDTDDKKGSKKQKMEKKKSTKKTASTKHFVDLSNNSNSNSDIGESTRNSGLPLAAIFGSKRESEILAEQRAVELAAKRHLEERERQRRRALTTKPKKAPAEQQPKQPVPERFPVPSHVGASDSSSKVSDSKSNYFEAKSILSKTLKHPSGVPHADVPPCRQLRGPTVAPVIDPILRLLSSALVAPTVIDMEDYRLWTDKYRIQNIPYDVCGPQNKHIAESCIGFVDEWKLERQKAHERRADKQEKLVRGTKKRSKKKAVNDIWDDDDDEVGLPAICLLTGPVGCGKTSLVHAVAKHCECRVIEINTTEKRGSQSLKNAIEEATQSDSTLDMLKNSAAPSFFSNQQTLVDTDDEDEKEGSAVPVILFDEADLLFENDGDSGFWTALKALSKKAKCPIFLTANVIPQALGALSMRFKHFSLEHPTHQECVTKLWQVIKSENIARKQAVGCDQAKRALASFAELCECDIRRMILELQLFTKSRNCNMIEEADVQLPDTASPDDPGTPTNESGPVVTSITPNIVPSNEQTLLKIEGRNFGCFAQNCSVSIGEQHCDAKVVNDTTILVLCPPFRFPMGLDQHGMFKDSGKKSYSHTYPLVKIETVSTIPHLKLGARIQSHELYDGSKMTNVSHCTIEYSFPTRSCWAPNSRAAGSIDEIDEPTSSVEEKEEEPAQEKEPSETALALFETAEKIFENSESMNVESKRLTTEDPRSCEELSRLANKLEIQSSVAWMEHSMHGLPYLAGASRGFGSAFVDGFGMSSSTDTNKLCKNGNAKPPPIEIILSNGWNDDECFFGNSDTFFTNPGCHERRLYSRAALCGRYCSLPSSDQSADAEVGVGGDELEQEDTNAKYFACHLDEDAFLIRETPLATLPSLVTYLLGDVHMPQQDNLCIANEVFSNRRKCMMRQTNNFLGQLWHGANNSQVFALGVARQVDGVTVGEHMDERIFLDYSPMLSNICAFEAAAIFLSEASTGDAPSSSRRSTRRSKELMRAHYFGRINQDLFEEDYREMGQERAKCLLRY